MFDATSISNAKLAAFQKTVWGHYDANGRHELPWRLAEANGSFDPYRILVSEIMLQQTQVSRVITKYLQFLMLFPTASDLARASLGDVLIAWQGLGYNRRAKFLWQAAQMVTENYAGTFPETQQELTKLPGVGANTAGAIMAYAYNQPVAYIETNIRTVYIHYFFKDVIGVYDKEISELVEASLPKGRGADTRLWYWALMDYGSYLKQTVGNKSRASKSYTKQSPLLGSRRAVRGAVIRYLSQKEQATVKDFVSVTADPRLVEVLLCLKTEGMVREQAGVYRLT